MDSMSAFMMGERNRGKPLMVFDWDEAARRIASSGATSASAGLRNDWEYTGGDILAEGGPVLDSYTYLASTWAVPEIEINGVKSACFRMQEDSPGWDSGTKWPESALAILDGGRA